MQQQKVEQPEIKTMGDVLEPINEETDSENEEGEKKELEVPPVVSVS